MPVLETVLLYVVVPLVVVLLFAGVTMIPGRGKGPAKYKPGQPWEHEAVWYEPHPDIPGLPVHGDRHDDHGGGLSAHGAVGGQTGARALTGGSNGNGPRALTAGDGRTGASAATAGVGATAAALALGEHPHTHEVDVPRRSAAGGARGTW
ncbi:hypothetical protein O2W14_07105 [Modestobacter sp. VKM Ac-2986]|uniref:aa3-type cytochrome oxidase subunit CtaJ n=1 Tax=Modestobacter sp. VKM Ac-2986 TaxID=3004140 RepID=UPI0022AA23F9|nr:hypothetical protein [Modestobacter sp. VKM Ac-2986]MCZ2828596.1 hypothetical protein [Modestobacter sp. VKM Ac-2986]